MRRSSAVGLAAALALAGCPLPQPLPDYPPGTITPPRILSSTTTDGALSIIPVPAGCATPPSRVLDAQIFYQENVTIDARWFVDYKADDSNRYTVRNTEHFVPPNPDATILVRQVPRFTFHPYDFAAPAEMGGSFTSNKDAGIVHVVELVVSNGFDDAGSEPNRTPAVTAGDARFEIQTYRWVFVNVAGLPCP